MNYLNKEKEQMEMKENVLKILEEMGLMVEGSFSLHYYNLLKNGRYFQKIYEDLKLLKSDLWEKYKVVRSKYIKENKK